MLYIKCHLTEWNVEVGSGRTCSWRDKQGPHCTGSLNHGKGSALFSSGSGKSWQSFKQENNNN